MTEVMNSLEPGTEDFGGGGAAAADQGAVSFLLRICVFWIISNQSRSVQHTVVSQRSDEQEQNVGWCD